MISEADCSNHQDWKWALS